MIYIPFVFSFSVNQLVVLVFLKSSTKQKKYITVFSMLHKNIIGVILCGCLK